MAVGVVIGAAASAIRKSGEIYSAAIDAHGDKAADAFHKAYIDEAILLLQAHAATDAMYRSSRLFPCIEPRTGTRGSLAKTANAKSKPLESPSNHPHTHTPH